MLALYRRLIQIRREHPCLRSRNFYPSEWSGPRRDGDGFGVDADQGLVVYHRWGEGGNGRLERFIVALNFSDQDRHVTLSFSENGQWADLLAGGSVHVTGYRGEVTLESNWGHIFLLA